MKVKGLRVGSEGFYSFFFLEVAEVRAKRMSVISNSVMNRNSEEKEGGVDEEKFHHLGSLKNGMLNKVGDDRLPYLEERNEEELSKRILKLSRLNKVRSVLKLFKSMETLGLQPNVHACNSLLSCLLRNGMVDDALRFFYFMDSRKMTTGHTCSLILKAIATSFGHDAALGMFEELEKNGTVSRSFDAIVYNTMISIVSKENKWIETEKIWRRLQERGLPGTTVTYRLLVCTFVRCNQYELAFDAYHEMMQNEVMPTEDAMHAIIGACAKEGKWDAGLSVFQSMLDDENDGLKPNRIACNALINTLGKAGKVKLAFKVYNIMKSLGHEPDAYTWNALLGALNQANRYADALLLFDGIRREHNSVINLHIYNTVLVSCQKLGLWEKALRLLWEMEASGLCLSTAPYNLVIGACEAARQPKVGLQIYDHMIHQKHTPDIFTLLPLIRSCIWGSLWTEMEEILNVSCKTNNCLYHAPTPSIFLFSFFFFFFSPLIRLDINVFVLFLGLLLQRYPPNGSMYNTAIQGLCLKGNINLAMKLHEKMNEWDLKPDGKTRALLLQMLHRRR